MADVPDYGALQGAVPILKSLGKTPRSGFPSKQDSPSVRAMKRTSADRPGAARVKRGAR